MFNFISTVLLWCRCVRVSEYTLQTSYTNDTIERSVSNCFYCSMSVFSPSPPPSPPPPLPPPLSSSSCAARCCLFYFLFRVCLFNALAKPWDYFVLHAKATKEHFFRTEKKNVKEQAENRIEQNKNRIT